MIADAREEDAIAAALVHNWKEAIRLNSLLLKDHKDDLAILNRLGFAHLMNGDLSAAKRIIQRVVKLDPYNQIALKNLKKLATVRQKDLRKNPSEAYVSPLAFLEEPGKTKMVECVNTAPLQALSTLSPGQEVVLKAKNHVVEVRSTANTYLGALPDDLSFRLLKLLAAGNRYQAFIKSVSKNCVIVLLREVARGKRFANHPSFNISGTYVPFSSLPSSGDIAEDEESRDKKIESE